MIRILTLFGLLVLGAGGYTVYWYWLAGRVDGIVAAEAQAWSERGVELAYAPPVVSGYPYRLITQLDDLALTRADGTRRWDWQTQSIRIFAQPWDLNYFIALFDGPARMSVSMPGGLMAVALDAADARASLRLDDGEGMRVLASDFDALTMSLEEREAVGLTAERIQLHARWPTTSADRADIVIRFDALTLPPDVGGVLGRVIAAGMLDSTVHGAWPDRWTAEAAAAWRDAGGAVDVRGLSVDWGPIRLAGEGRLTIDEALRPVGTIDSRIRGHDALVDALREAGILSEDAATAAHLVLSLAAGRNEAGESVLELPLTAGEGTLHLGPIPLGPLPPVVR